MMCHWNLDAMQFKLRLFSYQDSRVIIVKSLTKSLSKKQEFSDRTIVGNKNKINE